MQCGNCGRPLRPEELICPNCGEPVPQHAHKLADATGVSLSPLPSMPQPSGPPVDPYAPTIYGPPIGPERFGPLYAPSEGPALPRQVGGYRPVRPLARPAARRGRGGWVRALAVLSAACVVALLFMGALAASGQRIAGVDLSFLRRPAAPAAPALPSPTPTPACPAPPVNPQAAKALKNVQLTTEVVGANYQPANKVTKFAVGQYIYVTFQVATNEAGTIQATFCTNGALASGSKDVPAHDLNARGEFHPLVQAGANDWIPATLTTASVGPGVVTLRWNGAVAAVLPFTVAAQ
jgi:hypothetical protein